jgi:NAD(P)-dependent dehydrogenase (short-subunit alcohol dehydrogenase family)
VNKPEPATQSNQIAQRPTVWILGARTLGRAVALHFAGLGWKVVTSSRTQADVESVAKAVDQAGGEGKGVVCDLAKPESLRAVVQAETRIDLCIAAQTAGGRFGALPLVELPEDELRRGFDGYLNATWNLLRAVGPHMLERGAGTFIQVGTSSGVRTKSGYSALGAVQHGLRAMLQVAAKEWREKGVHVVYLPIDGAIESDRTGSWIEKNGLSRAIPQQSIAEACAFLHSQHPRGWTHELVLRPPGTDWTAPT